MLEEDADGLVAGAMKISAKPRLPVHIEVVSIAKNASSTRIVCHSVAVAKLGSRRRGWYDRLVVESYIQRF